MRTVITKIMQMTVTQVVVEVVMIIVSLLLHQVNKTCNQIEKVKM